MTGDVATAVLHVLLAAMCAVNMVLAVLTSRQRRDGRRR